MGSSRRSASDVNILAMLDGLGSRPRAKRTMLWYGAGGVLVCGLIGTVAWLAHEPAAHLDSTMVAAGLPPAPIMAAASAAPAQLERVSETLVASAAAQPAGRATIVNVDNETTPASASAAPVSETPAPTLRIRPAPRPAPAVHTTAVHTPAPKTVAAHVPPTRSGGASAHPAAAHANPKRSAPAIKPLPAPAAVDTDVALISAIIQHAAKRREAVEDSGCHDKPCGPRMPAQP